MPLTRLFLRLKPCLMFVLLKDGSQDWHLSKLSAQSKTTYAYTSKFLSIVEKQGLVKFEKKGRIKKVVLTEHGVSLASILDEFIKKAEAPILPPDTNTVKEQEKEEKPKEQDRSVV